MDKLLNVSVIDFFDIGNYEHLKAWKHLQETGCWPEGFIPHGIYFPTLWTVSITSKMADAYINTMLNAMEGK